MSQYSERYDKVATQFTDRVQAVPDEAWDNPAPCDGWVARDVVGHLVEWVPGFFSSFAGHELPHGPSVDDDPVAAWAALDAGLRATFADPDVATREFELHGATYTIEAGINTFCTNDVLIHTWDLARATGLDETLDPGEVSALLVEMEPIDEMLRQSGQYGPRVAVARRRRRSDQAHRVRRPPALTPALGLRPGRSAHAPLVVQPEPPVPTAPLSSRISATAAHEGAGQCAGGLAVFEDRLAGDDRRRRSRSHAARADPRPPGGRSPARVGAAPSASRSITFTSARRPGREHTAIAEPVQLGGVARQSLAPRARARGADRGCGRPPSGSAGRWSCSRRR